MRPDRGGRLRARPLTYIPHHPGQRGIPSWTRLARSPGSVSEGCRKSEELFAYPYISADP
jgi:hypothetical protein